MSNIGEYAKIRAAIIELQIRQKDIEESVKEDLKEIEGTLKTKYGTLYTSTRKVWKFDPTTKEKIAKLKNKLSDVEEQAKETGAATFTESTSIGFRKRTEA